MIIPIVGNFYYTFKNPKKGDFVYLVKEQSNKYDPLAVAAINIYGQRIGYVAKRMNYNRKLNNKMNTDLIKAKIWLINKHQILLEVNL